MDLSNLPGHATKLICNETGPQKVNVTNDRMRFNGMFNVKKFSLLSIHYLNFVYLLQCSVLQLVIQIHPTLTHFDFNLMGTDSG